MFPGHLKKSSDLSPEARRSHVASKGWLTKQMRQKAQDEEAETRKQKARLEVTAKLELQARAIRYSREVNPKTQRLWSQRAIAAELGLGHTTVERMLGPNYTGKPGKPTDMSEGARAILFDNTKKLIADNKGPVTSMQLATIYNSVLAVDRESRGVEPKGTTANTGQRRLRMDFESETDSTLKKPTAQTERREQASIYENVYAHQMNLKSTFIELQKHQTPGCPRGFIDARSLLLFDEMDISASGGAEGRSLQLVSRGSVARTTSDTAGRHITAAWFISADGVLLANIFIMSGSSNIVDPTAPPPKPLFLSKLILNDHGSMEIDLNGKGAMSASLEFLRTHGLDRMKPNNGLKEPPYILLMDNHATHVNEAILIAARTHNIFIATPPANSTHLLQPHDNQRINGQVKIEVNKLHAFHPNSGRQQHLHLPEHEQVLMKVNNLQNIVQAVRNCGLEYTDDLKYVGVTDEGARNFCDRLLREGKIRFRNESPVDSKRLRQDNILHTRALAQQGLLPPDLPALPSESVLSATIDALRGYRDDPLWKKGGSRKRSWGVDQQAAAGAREGTMILNDDAQLLVYHENILKEKLKAKAAAIRSEEKVKKAAIKETQQDERAKLAAALHARFPQVHSDTWKSWNRNLGRYFSGSWSLEQVVEKVEKLLEKRATTSDAQDMSA
jgi:hypothetical protein